MDKIIWKNNDCVTEGTPIPKELLNMTFKNGRIKTTGMIQKFYDLGYIKESQPINADFMNKYHFECYLEEYRKCKTDEDVKELANKIFYKG